MHGDPPNCSGRGGAAPRRQQPTAANTAAARQCAPSTAEETYVEASAMSAESKQALLPGEVSMGRERRASINSLGKEEYLSPVPRHMGIIGSVASVMNAVIGTGILALPLAFSELGVGLGTIAMIICATVCFFSLLALGQVVTKVGGTSYGTTMELSVGGWSGQLISVIVFAFTFGVCIVYSIVISANITDLLDQQNLIGEGDQIIRGLDNRRFWILFPGLGVVVPLCLVSQPPRAALWSALA